MCTCLKELTGNVHNRLKELKPELEILPMDYDDGIQNRAFSLSSDMNLNSPSTYSEFKYQAQPKKKDGTLGKTRKHSISIFHSFCPFCGKEFKTSSNDTLQN